MDRLIAENEKRAMRWFNERGTPPFSFRLSGYDWQEYLWDRRIEGDYIDMTKWKRDLVMTSKMTGLKIRADCTIYTDTPGLEWTLSAEAMPAGTAHRLYHVQPLNITIPAGGEVLLHTLNGSAYREDDWLPVTQRLELRDKPRSHFIGFGPSGGRSSNGASPFFNLQWPGGGVITAVGWSGAWRATFQRNWTGEVEMTVELPGVNLALEPGERVRFPSIMQIWWEGDDHLPSYNLFRQFMFKHVLPRNTAPPFIDLSPNIRVEAAMNEASIITPPIIDLCTSAKVDNASNEAFVYPHLEFVAREFPALEGYWIDAYQNRDGFPAGIGNYNIDDLDYMTSPRRFPNGMRPIIDTAHGFGLDFLLWQEPERVGRGSWLWESHPEWVLRHFEQEDSGLFDLSNPIAEKYMTEYLIKLVSEFGLDWLRIDFNIDPLPFWNANDGPGRHGITQIRYIEALYRMLDAVLLECPWVKIDNCASGGRRIDLEMCRRTTPLWRSDLPGTLFTLNEYDKAATLNQAMTAGLNRYVPYSTSGGSAETPYYFMSGFNGGIPILDETRSMSASQRAELNAMMGLGNYLRKYWDGDFYPLTAVTVDPKAWLVYQFHKPDQSSSGVIMAFRRPESLYTEIFVRPYGLDPSKLYATRAYAAGKQRDWRQPTEFTIAQIRITSPGDFTIMEYKEA